MSAELRFRWGHCSMIGWQVPHERLHPFHTLLRIIQFHGNIFFYKKRSTFLESSENHTSLNWHMIYHRCREIGTWLKSQSQLVRQEWACGHLPALGISYSYFSPIQERWYMFKSPWRRCTCKTLMELSNVQHETFNSSLINRVLKLWLQIKDTS